MPRVAPDASSPPPDRVSLGWCFACAAPSEVLVPPVVTLARTTCTECGGPLRRIRYQLTKRFGVLQGGKR